jgi:hypothetical protein
MPVDNNDRDDNDERGSSLGFKTHFKAEAALEKAKVFANQSDYPKKGEILINHTAHEMRVHRRERKTESAISNHDLLLYKS